MDERAESATPPSTRWELIEVKRYTEPIRRSSACERAPEVQHDDEQAIKDEFTDFFRKSIKPLVKFLATGLGISTADAADAAQEAMREAHRKWRTINNPHTWIRTVASRKAIRKLINPAEVLTDDVATLNPLLRMPPDQVVLWEEQQKVLRLLSTLPPRQRQVMAWTLDGYEPAEIAEQLRMTPEAVRSNLYKARKALAARLKASGRAEQ
ncbi:sigma-70 family RNA polymerase sigma factor [Micromonospora sp. NPDC023633]|uniref:RNA polymerase sigma factor n=1 Tax=Micromonospora sp. NPDC023633 TaxID=3154320 RepID=UPI0033E7026A